MNENHAKCLKSSTHILKHCCLRIRAGEMKKSILVHFRGALPLKKSKRDNYLSSNLKTVFFVDSDDFM